MVSTISAFLTSITCTKLLLADEGTDIPEHDSRAPAGASISRVCHLIGEPPRQKGCSCGHRGRVRPRPGPTHPPLLQLNQGWTDEEWAAAARRLVERGLLTTDGTVTDAGRRLLAYVEDATGLAAERPWRGSAAGEVAELLRPLAVACATVLPDTNPMGLRLPAA
ncbi:hypothetical protein ACIHFE_27940 [Streptomyces sp. NPDC052396]|uniref:helix-turn-helix domain-containing protein n=1 Tax=Streptomyces sp. NPDC052396 TaxID=3365689 RepID=UPI0037D6CAD6